MLDGQVVSEIRKISRNIERQLNSFESDFCEAKRRFEEMETYTSLRIRQLRASVSGFRNPNDISKWSDIIDGLEELQSIVDKVMSVDCPVGYASDSDAF
jgi:ribosomal protein S17E